MSTSVSRMAAALSSIVLTVVVAAALGEEDAVKAFQTQARQRHGAAGAKAAEFLIAGIPQADRKALSAEFLLENLRLALEARKRFAWAAGVPEEIFFNDVLPYAVLDEPRDPWRAKLLELGEPIVRDCRSASEAAQALNRELFKKVNVHYNTSRERPNQSPKESIEQGKASCTGLSILLADACRAVGVPARVAGTACWTTKPGNHTWVEVWDGQWHFMGADEYDAKGLDRAWFVNDAAQARSQPWEHAICATSWKATGRHFPLAWAPQDKSVAAVDVTDRYRKAEAESTRLFVRLRAKGERAVGELELRDAGGRVRAAGQTRAGRADLNDMPALDVPAGAACHLRVRMGQDLRELAVTLKKGEQRTLDLAWEELSPVPAGVRAVEQWLERPAERRGPAPEQKLTKAEAPRVRDLLWADVKTTLAAQRKAEFEARCIAIGDKKLKWLERRFGKAPAGGASLWISLHGGGGAPAAVNDQQWHNQIRLYQPAEGIYVAPRGPTDTWNLWHQAHIDALFDRLIADYVVLAGVDPNRVYLMGYSAGGDGVFQLAPRMADRWAAAAMMAGHPNEASPLGLRNLPFFAFVGGEDGAYNRNKVVAEWGLKLDELHKADPTGYVHRTFVYPGLGHWMNRKDAEALPLMAAHVRQAWPRTVVWRQDDVLGERFYWLAVSRGEAKVGQTVKAVVEGQTIRIEADGPRRLRLRLSDDLLDLDRPVTVSKDGKTLLAGLVARQAGVIVRSLEDRPDPASAASGEVDLQW